MNITIEMVGGFLAVLVPLLGLVFTVWWKVESKIEAVRAKAQSNSDELAAIRLHTAEFYVSKDGLREVTGQIMGAIADVKGSLDSMRDRIDRAFDKPGGRAAPRA